MRSELRLPGYCAYKFPVRQARMESCLRLDVFNDLQGRLLDQFHALSMAVLAQEARCSNDEINAVNTTLDSLLGILHIAPDVCEDLGLEAKVADGLAVLVRLLRRDGTRQFQIVASKIAKHRCNLDLVLSGEEGVCELLAFSQSAYISMLM